ncbi:CD209 antigen-like protein C [Eriocheir sinensis]|uniref:CD209 antigen-like protein C n=1 Tax=Eriocheir sinensis TaxID=95602 RepID=UPI0021C5E320|nr:CD209 antigen-like protein C [Eriocheir sinensis]
MARLSLLLLFLGLAALTAGQECTHPFIAIGGLCIYIDPWVTGTMEEMRAICKSHHGDLLWFDSDTDCDFYQELLTHIHETGINEKDYWMGITDEGHEGEWRYIKTNQVTRLGPPYWDTGYPRDTITYNCAMFENSRQYYWRDFPCTSPLAAICRYA